MENMSRTLLVTCLLLPSVLGRLICLFHRQSVGLLGWVISPVTKPLPNTGQDGWSALSQSRYIHSTGWAISPAARPLPTQDRMGDQPCRKAATYTGQDGWSALSQSRYIQYRMGDQPSLKAATYTGQDGWSALSQGRYLHRTGWVISPVAKPLHTQYRMGDQPCRKAATYTGQDGRSALPQGRYLHRTGWGISSVARPLPTQHRIGDQPCLKALPTQDRTGDQPCRKAATYTAQDMWSALPQDRCLHRTGWVISYVARPLPTQHRIGDQPCLKALPTQDRTGDQPCRKAATCTAQDGWWALSQGRYLHSTGWVISLIARPLPTQDRMGNQPYSKAATYTGQHTQKTHRHTSMPRAGFGRANPLFQWAQAVDTLDHAAPIIGGYELEFIEHITTDHVTMVPNATRIKTILNATHFQSP
jgi:hypothetical protein